MALSTTGLGGLRSPPPITGSLFLIGGTVPSYEQDSCSFQLCCSLIYRTVPSFTREDTVAANATTKKVNEQDTKTFSNVMLVGMASKISKTTHTSVWIIQDNGIKGAKTSVCTKIWLVCTFSLGTLDSVVS